MGPYPVEKNESVTNRKTDDTPGDRFGASSTEFPLTVSNQMMVSTISSPQRQRDLAVKELGISGTAFIGPACRPETATSKPDIEESLNEFYQELKQIDQLFKRSPGDSSENDVPFQTRKVLVPPVSKRRSHNFQERTPGPNNTHRLHWYQNEPYHVRRQGTSSNQNPDGAYFNYHHDWQPPPPHQNQPYPLSYSLPHCTPLPPRPVLFGSPHRELHVNRNWGYPEREKQDQQQGLQFPPAHRALVPEGSSYSQDYGGARPYHRNKGCYNETSYENVGCFNLNEGQDSGWYQGYNRQHDTYQQQDNQQPVNAPHDHRHSLVLILMRGMPGSGKSTLARELLSTGTSGLVLSTDDYFSQEKGYLYDSSLLRNAHDWNQNRAKGAMQKGCSPVVIDNTNVQAWEMKPYVKLALKRGYSVFFHEPATSWKWDPVELEKRNKHGVSREKIARMLDRFEYPISMEIVMNSQEPSHKRMRHPSQLHPQRTDIQDFS